MFSDGIFESGVILASASPRRSELLERIHLPFKAVASGVEEENACGADPKSLACANAAQKARAVASGLDEPGYVLGCDTVVSLNNRIFGKPADRRDAFQMLSDLSGKTHEVISGVCITDGLEEKTFAEVTKVSFADICASEIEAYLDSGEYKDKAGAYAIQGLGMLFVTKIEGDYNNVVGLPVQRLVSELEAFASAHPLHRRGLGR